ncbi:MAG: hypothetical protein PVH68_16840 [Armatimonadota bacterium]|jgi:hypothetical protein
MVASQGRIFTIEDLAPIALPLMPGKYTLVAREAFNGLVLWKRELANWENITHWMKPTPVQLSRRMVAVGDRVYATLGIIAPVTALDGATGKILKVYEGMEQTQEIVCAGGVLYLAMGDPFNPYGVKSGGALFIAGMPNEFPEDDFYRAVEGRAGGMLLVASAGDGKALKTYRLDSPPVWDGLAAANGRLVMSLASGQVQCWGPR